MIMAETWARGRARRVATCPSIGATGGAVARGTGRPMTTHEPVQDIDVAGPAASAGRAGRGPGRAVLDHDRARRSGPTTRSTPGTTAGSRARRTSCSRWWRWCVRRSAVATGCSGDCSDWRSACGPWGSCSSSATSAFRSPRRTPSIADYAWLAMDGVLLLALWVLLRTTHPSTRRSTSCSPPCRWASPSPASPWCCSSTRSTRSPGADLPDDVVVTNLAYPLLDIGMLVLVSGRAGRHRHPVVVHGDARAGDRGVRGRWTRCSSTR